MSYLSDNTSRKLLNENGQINIDTDNYETFTLIHSFTGVKVFSYWLIGFFSILFAFLFLPWTQNIQAQGQLTTIRPEDRPQTINTIISGRIQKWHVIEGQHVRPGDTLVQISEVKDKFLDPALIERTKTQLDAKKGSIVSYTNKVDALGRQIQALTAEFRLKTAQLKNKVRQNQLKVVSDSTTLEAARLNYDIAKLRLVRADSLFRMDIYSLTELESKRLKVQETENKFISSQNKYVISKNDLTNAEIDLNNMLNTFNTKLTKAESDRFSAETSLFAAQGDVAKLENLLANYSIRDGYYFITASREGYVLNIQHPGVGDIVKEGKAIVTLMPHAAELACALYVRPVDLPLIKLGEKIRIIFDGWPALVFSGWPYSSFGTFSGEVYAIDKSISPNGKYRVLVVPDPHENEEPWPEPLRVGAGAEGIFLLNDVMIWYELWRQINGFPPDYYDGKKSQYQLDETIKKTYKTGEE